MDETREISAPRRVRPVIVVTGSTGLIGTALLKAFSKDYTVVGLDLKRANQMPPGTQFVPCDLTSDESVTNALYIIRAEWGNTIASVLHLAADYGTSRLLKGLAPFNVEQFVFSSAIPVTAASKIEAESVIRRERGNIPAVILRIAGVYDEFGHAVPLAQQIHRIYHKQVESRFFPGDADHGEPFIHLEDLVEAFKQVVARRRELDPMEVFLIAEPGLMSDRDLQNQIGVLLHGKDGWMTLWAKNPPGEGDVIKPAMIDLADDHYPVSVDHARQRLGWQPRRRLREELAKVIDRLKQGPDRWFQANHLPGKKSA